MEQTGAKYQGWKLDIDAKLCGQSVFVKVPTVESSEASGTLRQLLLRCDLRLNCYALWSIGLECS